MKFIASKNLKALKANFLIFFYFFMNIKKIKGNSNVLDLDLKSENLSLELNFNLLKKEMQNRVSERIKQSILVYYSFLFYINYFRV